MPIIVCGAEGEWALYNNTLSTVGADDKRRGSVQLTAGETMFKAFSGGNDVWVHTRFGKTFCKSATVPTKSLRASAAATSPTMDCFV